MTRAEMNAAFARMKPGQQDLFIVRLKALANKLAAQQATQQVEDRQAHCDAVASELLESVNWGGAA